MERNIGEIFEYNGEWYQCVIGGRCKDCAFNKERKCYTFTDNNDPIGDCSAERRTDHKSVIFKKLEKVGEPFFVNIQGNNVLQQRYKLYELMATLEGYWYRIDGNFINIEIQQNKEDMKEKELKTKRIIDKLIDDYKARIITYDEFIKVMKSFYANGDESKPTLKEFDLEAAKAGKPVCTRDGREVRILCFDAQNKDYPIVALVKNENKDKEYVTTYRKDGTVNPYNQNKNDLMMLVEKKEGWVVIRRSDIYETEEQAKEVLLNSRVGVMIRKINWEE